MPWSSQIFIGVPLVDVEDAIKVLKKFDIATPEYADDLEWEDFEDTEDMVQEIVINGVTHELCFELQFSDSSDLGKDCCPKETSNSGHTMSYGVLFGAELTSRYAPSVIDTDWEHGRSDPFVLDLELLMKIRHEVGKFFPEAEILLMDVFY